MATEKKSEFVVTDRRKFTLDGDVRPDAETSTDEESAAAVTPPQSSTTAAPPPPKPTAPAEDTAATKQPPVQKEQSEPKKQEAQPKPEAMPETGYDADAARGAFGGQKIEFVHLLDALVQMAMMYAGAMDSGPERRVDIVGLRQMVDMIGVLEEKTRGNLTEQEAAILSNTLFQLRMNYMEIINMIDKQATQGGPGGNGGVTR